jgi:hypothetical protein
MNGKTTRIVELQDKVNILKGELDLLKMLNDKLEAINNKHEREIESIRAKRKPIRQLSCLQTQYVAGLLAKWRQTKKNCFSRATDKDERTKFAEEIANINEILGVMRTWEI